MDLTFSRVLVIHPKSFYVIPTCCSCKLMQNCQSMKERSWDQVIECFGLGVEEASVVFNTLRVLTYCRHDSSEMSFCLHCIIIPITCLCLEFMICCFRLFFNFLNFFFFPLRPVLWDVKCLKGSVSLCFQVFKHSLRCLLKFGETIDLSDHSATPSSTCLNFIHLRMH